MTKPLHTTLLTVFTVLSIGLALLLISDNAKSDSVIVATTIFPLADIVNQIAGPNVQVIQLIPGSESPHTFSPSSQTIEQLAQADILFAIGHELDNSVINAAPTVKNIPTTIVDEEIQFNQLNYADEQTTPSDNKNNEVRLFSRDPHYWLSVPNTKIIAGTIAAKLITIDPRNKDTYNENLAVYQHQLDLLEQELQTNANLATQRNFIATHNAWAYFSDQYNFNLIGVLEPSEGQQPSNEEINTLKKIIQGNQITTFFSEPQTESDVNTKLMQELDLDIKTLDPIGGTNESDSYVKLMRRNLDALTENR